MENPNDSLSLRHIAHLIIQNHNELVKAVSSDAIGIKEKRIESSNLLASLWDSCGPSISLHHVLTQYCKANADHPFYPKLKAECLDLMLSLINEHGGKRSYLPEFLEKTGLLIAPGKNARGVIDEIREWCNDLSDTRTGAIRKPIEIYNMPSSKGLEGHVVFVVGATENLMPKPNNNIEEQARLFYVAMTRAKRKLHLFSSRSRPASITFRPDSFQMSPSPFVNNIPATHMESKYIPPKKKGSH